MALKDFLTLRRLALLTAALYGLSFWRRPPIDPDLGWHLLGGAWMRVNGRVPEADFINSFNAAWHDYHWLAQLVMHWLYEQGGYELLRLALGVLMAGVFLLLCRIVALVSLHAKLDASRLLPLLGAGCFFNPAVMIRPQMLALFVVALALQRLIQKPRKWELPYLFLLAVFLVNMHVYWIFIPLLWCFYRCSPRFFRRRSPGAWYAWGGTILLALAGLVSPYGLLSREVRVPDLFANYFLLLDYIFMPPKLKNSVVELQGFSAGGRVYTGLWLVYFAWVLQVWRAKRCLANLGNTLSASLGLILSFSALKYAPLFALLSLPFLARHSRGLWRARRAFIQRAAMAMLSLGAAALFALSVATFPFWYVDDSAMKELVPLGACQAMADLPLKPAPGRTHVRALTFFEHGGWCRWIVYQKNPQLDLRVTTDNRTQWVPPEHYELSWDLFTGQRDWWRTLQAWDPDVALVKSSVALASILRLLNAHWKKEYDDGSFAVFTRRRAAYSGPQ